MNLYYYRVHTAEVIDGDTLDLVIDLGFDVRLSQRCRLYGINTPESHSRASDRERAKGDAAKKYLHELVTLSTLYVQTHRIRRRTGEIDERTGKYGRYLVTLWRETDGGLQDVGAQLVENGHANVYHGGARPAEWEWLGEGQLDARL